MADELLDTTVLVDVMRGDENAASFINAEWQAGNSLAISVISAMELLVGCRSKQEVAQAEKLIERFIRLD